MITNKKNFIFPRRAFTLTLALFASASLTACSALPEGMWKRESRGGTTEFGPRRTPVLNPDGHAPQTPQQQQPRPLPPRAAITEPSGSTNMFKDSPYDQHSAEGQRLPEMPKPSGQQAQMQDADWTERWFGWAKRPAQGQEDTPEEVKAALAAPAPEDRKPIPGNPEHAQVSLKTETTSPLAPLQATPAETAPPPAAQASAPPLMEQPEGTALPLGTNTSLASEQAEQEMAMGERASSYPSLSTVPAAPERLREVQADHGARTEELRHSREEAQSMKRSLAEEPSDVAPAPERSAMPEAAPAAPEVLAEASAPLPYPIAEEPVAAASSATLAAEAPAPPPETTETTESDNASGSEDANAPEQVMVNAPTEPVEEAMATKEAEDTALPAEYFAPVRVSPPRQLPASRYAARRAAAH